MVYIYIYIFVFFKYLTNMVLLILKIKKIIIKKLKYNYIDKKNKKL